MSYGIKYTLTFRDEILSTTLYKINIYKTGYVGGAISVVASDNPISLAYKKQDLISNIIGSELTIGLISQVNGYFLEFSTAAPLQYYVDVLKSTNNGSTYTTYWSGVNTTDAYTEPYQNAPYAISLKFNCGLGELQWRRYENSGSILTGMEQVINTIANCLSFLPYQKNVREIINIREDTMVDTQGLFEQMFLDDATFLEIGDDGVLHGMMCQKIIQNILVSLNCRIYQSNNMWYIERIWERTQTSLTYFDYTPSGTFQSATNILSHIGTGFFDPRITINNASQPKLVNGGDWQVTKKQPIILYDFQIKAESEELIMNPYFEDNPQSVNANGTPRNWDLGANVNAADVSIQVVNPTSTNLQDKWGCVFNNDHISKFNTAAAAINKSQGWGAFGNGGLNTSVTSLNSYGIHPVKNAGDTYTKANMYVDPTGGSLQFDLAFFFSWEVIATSAVNIGDSAYPGKIGSDKYIGDAFSLVTGGPTYVLPFGVRMYDANGNWYALIGDYLENNLSNASTWLGGNQGTIAWFGADSLAYLNYIFPNPAYSNQAVPISANQMAQMLYNSWNNGSPQPFYLNFLAKYQATMPFSNNPGSSGIWPSAPTTYNLDVRVFPPLISNNNIASGAPNTNFNNCQISLNQFGVNTCSINYLDQFSGASGYTKFYTTSDYDTRWSELKVSPVYGDTFTPGYPNSFRLSSDQPTTTWHVHGEGHHFRYNTGLVSGAVVLNNFNPTLVTSLEISTTDQDSESTSAWLAAMASGQYLTISGSDPTNQYVFQISGAPVNHTTYYTVTVTYVSGSTTPLCYILNYASESGPFTVGETVQGQTSGAEGIVVYDNTTNGMLLSNITGSFNFSVGETIKGLTSHKTFVLTAVQGNDLQVVYQGGQILADLLFNKFVALTGVYRRSIRGNIMQNGGIGFWQSVVDEDGTLYAQTSNKFDFKKGTLVIDLEETSAAPPGTAVIVVNQSISRYAIINPTPQLPNNALQQTSAIALSVANSPLSLASSMVVSPSVNKLYPTE